MPKKQRKARGLPELESVRAAYAAIVDYHNNLAQIRFSVAGLFLVSNGVLASGIFQISPSELLWPILPGLGVLLSILCWFLDVRNYQLLENLSERGRKIEEYLRLPEDQGFFSLMDHQPSGPRLIPFRVRLEQGVSHTTVFSALYTLVGLIWLSILMATAFKP